MKVLDAYSFPLKGAALIEASAGTGKTYTIVNLFLRLILGHNCGHLGQLGIENILVVTFTNAATAELKERIRARIHQCYLDFYLGKSDDDFIQQLINDSVDLSIACEQLSLAEKQMDESSIFTIHSFCQKMLSEYAFESGSVFDEQFELDESTWLKQAVEDYWRKYIVTMESSQILWLQQIWSTPEQLQHQLKSLIHKQVELTSAVELSQAQAQLKACDSGSKAIKTWWIDNQVSAQLQQAKLKGNTRLGKKAVYEQMDSFCQSQSLMCPFKQGWVDFFPARIEKAKSAKSPDLSALDFSLFEQAESNRSKALADYQQAIMQQALTVVRDNLARLKQQNHLLTPDDLLTRLRDALAGQQGDKLAKIIRTRFKAALIDEFQDTDDVQFALFRYLYPLDSLKHSFTMIGDPKQAIYAFRGADIYTYIQAKRDIDVESHFTLDTNWRSQGQFVQAVNTLFAQSENGFMFDQDIPFIPIKPARNKSVLKANNQVLPSLNFCLLKGDKDLLSSAQAKPQLALQTANTIADMLSSGQVESESENGDMVIKPISAGDCCVLVRDRVEAGIIKQALNDANIECVFQVRHSVFDSQTSHDLYRVLEALADPTDDRKLKAALMSSIFCRSAHELDTLFQDEYQWQQLVEQCLLWRTQWQKQSVMLVINRFLHHFDVFARLIANGKEGLRQITDLRHLIELLQHQSSLLPGESQLVYWLGQQMQQPDHASESQQLRLETDENLVQIITMHTSKGLEFPVVFIPFSSSFRQASDAIFHDDNRQLQFDTLKQSTSLQKADEERLAEDIRLLYVALTRAIHHCFVGIWNPSLGRTKQSGLLHTAIGRLLLKSDDLPLNETLVERLSFMQSSADIGVQQASEGDSRRVFEGSPVAVEKDYSVASLSRPIQRDWRITSYSAIAKNQHFIEADKPGSDEKAVTLDTSTEDIDTYSDDIVLDRFSFTRGAQAGSFLHGVFENIDFQCPHNLTTVIAQQGTWYGIEEHWFTSVELWLKEVLITPIELPASAKQNNQQKHFSLAELSSSQICAEMEFHLPLHKVNQETFNALINKVFPATRRHYQFEQLNGMLKGFIDLTFVHDNRFYVADYKSNHIGDTYRDYSPEKLEQAMIDHDYHLQSLLYILALHRWLKVKINNYDYDQHVGGAYYWFLRGMSKQFANSGVYYFKPEKAVIESLDRLFDGNQVDQVNQEQNDAKPSASDSPQQLGLWS